MIPILETSLLVLKPLTLADAPACQRLFPHMGIVRYMTAANIPWPYPPDGAETFYREAAIPAIESGAAAHWSIRRKSAPDSMIGAISLHFARDENRGFWLGLPYQGQGYMTEACARITDYWFRDSSRNVLRVSKAAPNAASRRISEREGARVVEHLEKAYVGGIFLTERWELTRETWLARNST